MISGHSSVMQHGWMCKMLIKKTITNVYGSTLLAFREGE